MQFLFDVVQFVVHVLDLRAQTLPVIILLAAPELPVDLPHFALNVPVFLPDMTVGVVAAHGITDVRHHPIQVVHFRLQFPKSIVPSPVAAAFVHFTVVIITLRNGPG